jgi:hypothetical protein
MRIASGVLRMAWVWNCDLRNNADGARISFEAHFTDSEEARLRAYDQYTDELKEISIVQHGAPGQLQLVLREGEGVIVTTELPSDEQVYALLHCLRPFVLENEDTHFPRVARTIGHRANNEWIRLFLRIQRDLYMSKRPQQMIKYISQDTQINCEATLLQWLNAYGYHRDADKRRALEDLHRLLPLEASRAIFITMLYDKTDAIRNLHSLVRLILRKQDTWTWTATDVPIRQNSHAQGGEHQSEA